MGANTSAVLKVLQHPGSNEEIRKAFMQLDKNNDGTLDKKEWKTFATIAFNEKLGGESKLAEFVEEAWAEVDANKDGRISFDEFEEYIVKLNNKHVAAVLRKALDSDENEERLHELFKSFDRDANGYLDKQEWKKFGAAAFELDSDPNGDLTTFVEAMFKTADKNKDGVITFAEFKKYLNEHK